MNVGTADMRWSNNCDVGTADWRVRAQHRVYPQRQTHDESGDDSQSHSSSRIQVSPL